MLSGPTGSGEWMMREMYWLVAGLLLPIGVSAASNDDDLLQMDLNQLMQVKLEGTATLTPTATRRMPASITSIDRSMIEQSGARSLFDLLEIYVPNFHYLPHHWEAPHMGMRGLIGDRDDKYLLVVNGRVLNEKTHFGALSERDTPLLADIRKIDVVRGPGSVVYGPGAVSMVINIQTDTFADHGPDGMTVRWGEGEAFRSVELKNAVQFGDSPDHGLLLYAGISDYAGASSGSSPLTYGLSSTTSWGDTITGGQPVSYSTPNNHESFHDRPKLKLHAHYQKQDFNAWLRFTQGGEKLTWEHKTIYSKPNGSATPGTPEDAYATNGVGYQQLTFDMSQLWVLNSQMWFEMKGGYDSTVYVRELWNSSQPDVTPENHREEEYLLRGTLNWNHSASHATALGSEVIYSRWGLSTSDYDHAQSSVLGEMDPWDTYAVGVFGEHQWQINSWLTQFTGLRADKDQYTGWMWSPRLALVAALSERDTLKGILSRSLRKNNAEELRAQHLAGEDAEPEQLSSAELIYGRELSDSTRMTLTGFYNKAEILGINFATLHTQPVGEFKYGGLEFELNYQLADVTLGFSHSYSKLDDFDLAPGASTRITASHLGYGNDLNNWSNHITKFTAAWQLDPAWQLTSSLRYFWGYEGAQDQIDSTNDARENNPNSSATNLTDPGYNDSVQEAAFLDLGLHYQTQDYGKFSLNGYNLLGLLDKRFNKRLYLLNVGNYRPEAVAVGLSYRYNF
jgi:outer membrane receptor for ferrienterochelin and colicins